VTKAVLHGMLSNRAGRIINISSTSGQAGRPGQANYSAAKAGLIGATKALAAEVGKRGVLVNAVAPGLIETDMLSGLPLEKVLPAIPLGRIGSVDEVAGIVTYLCSNQAAYITGQVIGINGGLYV
jgi:3-oxoacyl-[acyl-carrier protein] reductase